MSHDVYGIDLGTTYSAIARINEQDAAEVINNFEGDVTTPSAIFFEEGGNVVVGAEAKRVSLADPDNSCLLIKREMGTDYKVDFRGQTFTPESLSALILKSLVDAANSETNASVSKVVITVPAYFGTQEREATRQAGVIAGLEVVGIVTEPVAAALSISMRGGGPETVMVYDLGGGTFDTTVMRIAAGEVTVVGIDGNRTLGGADWDAEMVRLMLEKFQQEAGADAVGCEFDEEFMLDLQLRAEDAKKSLTKRESIQQRLGWEGARATITITREEFEAATAYLVDQTVAIAERTVKQAQAKEPGLTVDRVLLVGGSSRMPMIATALKSQLGWEPVNTDFDLAVAKGAAIYGQAQVEEVLSFDGQKLPGKVGAEKKFFLGGATSLSVQNVLARSLGLEFKQTVDSDPYIAFVAHANDSIPCELKPITAQTLIDGQTSVLLALYEQAGEKESSLVEDNRKLKDAELDLPRPMPKGTDIELVMEITTEGLIKVHATEPQSGNSVMLEAAVSQLSPDQVAEAASQVSALTLRS